jgi:hypothetical protein
MYSSPACTNKYNISQTSLLLKHGADPNTQLLAQPQRTQRIQASLRGGCLEEKLPMLLDIYDRMGLLEARHASGATALVAAVQLLDFEKTLVLLEVF